MLAYHPAFDANHCVYRFLHLFYTSEFTTIEWDKLRIADFYYLFPHLLKTIKPLPMPLHKGKKHFNNIAEPYEKTPNPKRLMFDLRDIQNSAITSLIAKGIVDREEFHNGNVTIISKSIPNDLQEKFSSNPLSTEE